MPVASATRNCAVAARHATTMRVSSSPALLLALSVLAIEAVGRHCQDVPAACLQQLLVCSPAEGLRLVQLTACLEHLVLEVMQLLLQVMALCLGLPSTGAVATGRLRLDMNTTVSSHSNPERSTCQEPRA